MVNVSSIIFVLIGAVIAAVGAILLKKGAHISLKRIFSNKFLGLGLSFYGASTIFYILALRNEELSIVYPLVSTTYIWTTIFSVKYLNEKMNKYKIVGVLGILLGVFFIGMGS